MKKLILLITLLAGCSSHTPESTIVHPSWPTPVKEFTTEWKGVIIDNKPYMAIEYSNSQELRIWLEDIKRYLHQSNNMICYYRTDLNEVRCQK